MISIKGKVEGGAFSNERHLLARLKTFEGQRVDVQIREHKPKRTGAQNRLLWVVYGQAAAKSGHTPMEIHEGMGVEYRSYKDAMGMVHITSTTEMSTERMAEYIEEVCFFFGLPVPGEEDDEF